MRILKCSTVLKMKEKTKETHKRTELMIKLIKVQHDGKFF